MTWITFLNGVAGLDLLLDVEIWNCILSLFFLFWEFVLGENVKIYVYWIDFQ